MPREPLFPHIPKREPLYPHVPRERMLGERRYCTCGASTTGNMEYLRHKYVEHRIIVCGHGGEPGYDECVARHSWPYGKSPPRKELPSLLPQVEGEPVPPEFRHLIGWVDEPLPRYAAMVDTSLQMALMPQVEGERKVDIVLKQLKSGVESIQQSDQFRLFLTTMSKFHDYSIGNQILIMIQRKDATKVAGFNTWKDLGRWVKKGEKGISILAPVLPPRPTCPSCGTKIPKGAKYCPGCGREVEVEPEAVEPRYFKVVYVFDIAQTEGKPLPEFEVPVLTGEMNEELFTSVMSLAEKQGIVVSFESRPHQDPEIKGSFRPPRDIWVRPEESKAQQLKSLLHEVAHYYTEEVLHIPRRYAETIAESAAFVVGAHYGFDTGVRSFPYVALWAEDKKVLEENLQAIRKVATTMLDSLSGIPSPARVILTKVDPRGRVSKFCCRQCGECVTPELLEEGRFLDRISWLRTHYKERHPGLWGKQRR